MLTIAREGKGKGFETENQEVLIRTYTRRGKEARFETVTQEVLSTHRKEEREARI